MGKIIDLSEVRMQSLRKELDAYQEAIRSAEEALSEAEAELNGAIDEEADWEYEYISEEEVARENGCTIDDDGHWIPIEDDEDDWW